MSFESGLHNHSSGKVVDCGNIVNWGNYSPHRHENSG